MGTNAALEKAIDEVGRDRVFLRARSYGWGDHPAPPEFVWWGIVQELRDGTALYSVSGDHERGTQIVANATQKFDELPEIPILEPITVAVRELNPDAWK